MDECVPFNPLDKESLAVSIERALLAEEPHALGEINKGSVTKSMGFGVLDVSLPT